MAGADANPFDALPAMDFGAAHAAATSGNPFDDLPPLDLSAKAAAKVSPHPGALANSADDGYGMSMLKGMGTAAIKGVGDIPGVIGNLTNAGEAVGDYGLATLQTLGGFRGGISEQAAKNAAAREAMRSDTRKMGMPVPGDYVPTGETFSNPVLARTGEYVPESPLGRIGMAGVEAGVGAGLPGAGIVAKAGNLAGNVLGGTVGQAVTEATGNPVLGMAAGAGAQSGGHFAGNVAQHGRAALADAIPPITEKQKAIAARRTVGNELNAAAADRDAALSGLAAGNPETVPGSQATTGPLSGDRGLLTYEKAVSQSPEGQAAYGNRMDAQNSARQAAVAGIQPHGDVLELPEAIRANAANADAEASAKVDTAKIAADAASSVVDQATAEHVQRAEGARQSALADIQALKPDASPQDVAGHFRAMRDALEAEGAGRQTREQSEADRARAVTAPNAQNPEQVGSALRTPFDTQAAAAAARVKGLYDALPQDMRAPTFGIAAKAKDLQAAQLPEHSPISGEEARLYGLASQYGGEMPLANVNALRGSILSARSMLRQSDPQAYGRLGQLLPAVDTALDHAIENRAALDDIAVRRGAMAPEDAIGTRVDKFWKENSDRDNYNLSAGAESYGQNAGSSAGPVSGGNGALGATSRGSGGSLGDQGLSRGTGSVASGNASGRSRASAITAPRAPRDQTLNQFLAANGGLRPSPELAQIFDTENPRKIIRPNGMGLDQALQRAKDAGYLHDAADTGRGELTVGSNELLAKIEQDHRNGDVTPYGSANEDWRLTQEARAEETALKKALTNIGVSTAKLDPQIVRNAVGHMLDGMDAFEAFGKASAEFHEAQFGSSAGEGTKAETPRAAAAAEPEAPPIREDWQVTGSKPLREANAAYREKKQTFDEGPIGEAFAKVGRGEPAKSNAELAGAVFHSRPTAGEDMRAYLKAAGPEGVKSAADAAAYSFHQAAMKNGVIDPKQAAVWVERHKTALGELPENVRAKFETAGEAQKAVEETMARTRDNLVAFDKAEAGKVAKLSNDGDIVKHVGSILDGASQPAAKMAELQAKAKGNPAAVDGLKRAVVEHVLNKFLPEGAEANTDRLGAYVAAKRDVLSKVMSPEEIDKISSKAQAASSAAEGAKAAQSSREAALKATEREGAASVKEAETSRKEILSQYDKGVLGRLKGLGGSEADILNTVRRALVADNGATQMGVLAKEAAKVPGATDALKKAVAKAVHQAVQSTAEAGASGELQMRRAELAKIMSKQTDALKAAGLSDQQIGVLRAVVDDGLQANRIISATSARGGSDSVQNLLQAVRQGKASEHSILTHLGVDGALVAGGHHLFGPVGAVFGPMLGEKVMGALRDAGLDRIQKLRVEAVLNPPVALELMREFPKKPDTGTAAGLGLRLRQMSLAGILANQTQH